MSKQIIYFGSVFTAADGNFSNSAQFTVSGVSVTPTAGAVYSNNGQTFTITTTSISGGSGTIKSGGTGAPSSSGTLTKVSGTGAATISFSATAPLNWYSYPGFSTSNSSIPAVPLNRIPNASTDSIICTDNGSNIISGVPANYSGEIQSFGNMIESGSYAGTLINNLGGTLTGISNSGVTINGDLFLAMSTNSSASFTPLFGFTNSIRSLACSSDGTKVYALGLDVLFYSGNTGQNFAQIQSTLGGGMTAVCCSSDGSIVYIATEGGVFKSTNFGVTFARLTAFGTSFYLEICCSADGSHIFAGASSILNVSTNGGTSASNNQPVSGTWEYLCCSSSGQYVYAARSTTGFIYYSSNNGSSLTAGTVSKSWNGIFCSPDGSYVYGTETDLWKSTNFGVTFTDVVTAINSDKLLCDSSNNITIAPFSGFVGTSSNGGVTITTNGNYGPWTSICGSSNMSIVYVANSNSHYGTNTINNCTLSGPVFLEGGNVQGTTITGIISWFPNSGYNIVPVSGSVYEPTGTVTVSGTPLQVSPIPPQDPGFLQNGNTFNYNNITWVVPTGGTGFFVQ